MERDDDLRILMSGLRGSNLDQSDFAADGQQMSLLEDFVDSDAEDSLPLTYEPDLIAEYWSRRPVSVVRRMIQLLRIGGGFLGGLITDILSDSVSKNEVKRAIELRDILTSLGPFYIKIGQALSIRPDILVSFAPFSAGASSPPVCDPPRSGARALGTALPAAPSRAVSSFVVPLPLS